MTDITAIAAFFASIKNATDIAKALRTIDASYAQAELKLKIAELLESLADAKISATEFQEILSQKEMEIARLTEALSTREEIVRRYSAYYKKGPNGAPIGDPFCQRCWEVEKKLFHLIRDNKGNGNRCAVCSTLYDYYETKLGLTGDEKG